MKFDEIIVGNEGERELQTEIVQTFFLSDSLRLKNLSNQ